MAFERSRRVEVGAVDTFVAEAGPADAAPIVMLHGNPDTHDVWSEMAPRLAPEFRCIAPDLPNWGASIAPRRFDVSLANQAAYVHGLVDALGLDTFHLAVHDIGGAWGLAFATEHPARIRTLSIFNTSFSRDYRWHRLGRLWRKPVIGELIMLVALRRWFVDGICEAAPLMPRAYAERAWRAFRCRTRRMVLRYYRAMDYAKVLPGWDDRFLAATRSIPKQVIWGDKDPYVPAAMAERFEAPVHHLAEASHWAMMEDPIASATLVGALARAGKPAATGS